MSTSKTLLLPEIKIKQICVKIEMVTVICAQAQGMPAKFEIIIKVDFGVIYSDFFQLSEAAFPVLIHFCYTLKHEISKKL